ncbi:MAG: endonuclease/exonuclease/phosphatase family protein [Myxococcales bacterium]|nr:endonuclease/exonuclease/phosphatase family protein [Myxococcales bacterium]
MIARACWFAILLVAVAACDRPSERAGARFPDDASALGDVVDAAFSDGSTEDDPADLDEPPDASLSSGSFKVLTYNVAGLPQGISSSNPIEFMPLISPLLDDFDLVVVQEDFWYHAQLIAEIHFPYTSMPWKEKPVITDIGDGLNRFSRSPFRDHTRIAWPGCNGQFDCASDCLATKGFSVARHTLAPGVEVDVYNLHMEAGGCAQDVVIRGQSIELLLQTLLERSAGMAVIMAGDFNLHQENEVDLTQLQHLIDAAGLSDSCWSTNCGKTLIDRILVRSSSTVELTTSGWNVPKTFVSADGTDLSDHKPVSATVHWRRL